MMISPSRSNIWIWRLWRCHCLLIHLTGGKPWVHYTHGQTLVWYIRNPNFSSKNLTNCSIFRRLRGIRYHRGKGSTAADLHFRQLKIFWGLLFVKKYDNNVAGSWTITYTYWILFLHFIPIHISQVVRSSCFLSAIVAVSTKISP